MKNFKKIFSPDKLSTLLLYMSILIFIIAFNFAHNLPSGWYQQFLPDLNGRSISDITFIDSLTGYAIAYTTSDTDYVLKTSNGGDNWQINYRNFFAMTGVQFLNLNTGYACGGFLYKTTNDGANWFTVNTSGIVAENMYVLNEDTIWLTDANGLVGGVFRTTNGGANWQQQLALGNQNPSHIYMYNARIGFASTGAGLYKTTNSGVNWFVVSGGAFFDMYFADSLTGWKCANSIKKTTDGGFTWDLLPFPPKSDSLLFSRIDKFSFIGLDTIWGVGGLRYYPVPNIARAIIWLSTNGGQTWGYQQPDTSINIFLYYHIKFVNKFNGWSYSTSRGVHTITGGNDTTYYFTGIKQVSNYVRSSFSLEQNYPNPFNPKTIIDYELRITNFVEIKVYNVLGNEIKILVNQKQNAGEYKIEFNGSDLSSGIYFYSLIIDGIIVDTKKMILVR